MKLLPAALLLAAIGCAVAAAFWWRESSPLATPDDRGAAPDAATRADQVGGGSANDDTARPEGTARESEAPPSAPDARKAPAGGAPAGTRALAAGAWPVARPKNRAGSTAALTGEPAVAAELAFHALALVGVDPEAEKTWLRAIDDPNMPPGVRSDLIEDLNQEGFTDNSHPTAKDLPLVRARLELIERLSPSARDQVNAASFEEAYKDLLEMYVRLGGEPRTRR